MNYLSNPVQELSEAMAHALYVGANDVVYEDRDWDKATKEDRRVTKKRRPQQQEIYVVAMFPQTWSSTALGFGGIGGQAITTAYTVVLQEEQAGDYLVYFNGRFAYKALPRNQAFWGDLMEQQLKDVRQSVVYQIKDSQVD